MSLWKKVAGGVMTAALLSSLLATSAFAAKSTSSTGSDQTNYLNCAVAAVHSLDTCSQVADGISTVTLSGDPDGAAGVSLFISASGASIIAVSGAATPPVFTLAGGTVTTGVLAAPLAATDTITLRAPTAAGSSVVSVYTIAPATGIASLEGTLTITWTASSGLDVSTANSVVMTTLGACAINAAGTGFTNAAYTTAAAGTGVAPVAHLCVLVLDGNSSPVKTAAGGVAATITPIGLLTGLTTGQTTTATTGANGVADITILSTGIAGVGTISVSVTVGTKTTTFAPKTFTFSGAVASIVATGAHVVAQVNNASLAGAVTFTAKDSAGNKVATVGATVVKTGTIFNGAPTIVDAAWVAGTYTPGTVVYACGPTAGSGTIAVKNNSVTSNAVTVYCSGAADTFTVKFDKESVAPGGQATLTATVKDDAGNPAPDGVAFSVVVSSGAVLATTASVTANGVVTWTFLAPFNTGVVTALVSGPAALTTTSPQSASIMVSTPQPVGPVTWAPTTSALGNVPASGYTFPTKIQKVGGYITWRVDGGSGLAGKTIQIWVYKKYSLNGAWSPATMLTTRKANADGVAFVNIYTKGILWISLRPVLPASGDQAASWGPTSIGRWVL